MGRLSNSSNVTDRAHRQLPMARVWPPAQNQFIPEENVDVAMPPLDVQRHLLDLYFIYVHPVFPVVHKALFWKDYEAAWV